jgi:hypothetical protein
LRPYQIVGQARIEAWLATCANPDQRYAFLVWLEAASIDPEMVTTEHIERVIDGKPRGRLNVSDVAAAGCTVTFAILGPPVRALNIVNIRTTT